MADDRTPLLYLVHRIPFPPNKGDKVRSHNILRRLAQRHRVFLGTFVDHPDDRQYVGCVREWCEEVHVVELDPRWARLASLRGLLTGEALSLPYYRNRGLAQWVESVTVREQIQSAVAFSGPMAQYLKPCELRTRVVDFCDLDSAKWGQYAADRMWPMSWLYRREAEKLLAFERSAALGSDASLFVTEAEAALFKAAAPEVGSRVGVMRNGVDAEFFSPEGHPNPYEEGGRVLLFTGAMDYWPNIDAVTWFAAELLPRIRERYPDVCFWIVGMNPAPAVQALAAKDVRVTGTVADVRPYLAHADVVVVPLRIARGIQNKVLEAMAMAKPVVVSEASAAGLDAVSGVDCEVAHGADGLISGIFRLFENDVLRRKMGVAARRKILDCHSWGAHLDVLDTLIAPGGADHPLFDGALENTRHHEYP